MKLIVLHQIRNVPALGLRDENGKTVIKEAANDYEVPKGTIFEIGDPKLKLCDEDMKKLRKSNSDVADIIGSLAHAKCIGDATNLEVVAAVQASIKEDAARESAQNKIALATQDQGLANRLLEVLTGLQPKAKA